MTRRVVKAVPNLLSTLRLALAVALPFTPESWWLAILLLAGFTDWFDGYVARRFHATGPLGGLLDAVADKAFVLSALVAFALSGRLEPWQVPLLLVRDLAVAAMSGFNVATSAPETWKRFWRSRWAGKATTFATFAYLALVLASPGSARLHEALYVLAASLNAIAALDYFVQFRRARARRT